MRFEGLGLGFSARALHSGVGLLLHAYLTPKGLCKRSRGFYRDCTGSAKGQGLRLGSFQPHAFEFFNPMHFRQVRMSTFMAATSMGVVRTQLSEGFQESDVRKNFSDVQACP